MARQKCRGSRALRSDQKRASLQKDRSERLSFHKVWDIVRAPMANRAIWSMRKRHEWLTTPLKKKRVKRATRVRCGLQDAMDRKASAAEGGQQ